MKIIELNLVTLYNLNESWNGFHYEIAEAFQRI